MAEAQLALTWLYYDIHDVPAALMAARQAYQEDAYLSSAATIVDRLFWGSIDLEQFIQARRWCSEGAGRFPGDQRFAFCELWLMTTPALPADDDRAWALVAKLDSILPTGRSEALRIRSQILAGGVVARVGLADSARRVWLRARSDVTTEIDPTQLLLPVEAYVRTLAGDLDESIDLLKRYVAANPDHDFAHTAGTAWWWRDLRAHPRFNEIAGAGG